MRRWMLGALLLAGLPAGGQEGDAGRALAERYGSGIRTLLEARCLKCHNADKKKGGISYAGLQDPRTALRERRTWRKAADQIASGEMPPEGEPALAPADRKRLLEWMRGAGAFIDCADPAEQDPGPPQLRRLTRTEYDLTVRDLLGISFDAGERAGFPAESTGHAFDTLAAGLVLPPALMDKYFAAAELALERFGADVVQKKPSAAFAWKLKPGEDAKAAGRRVLAELVRRAHRRPPAEEELARYTALYERGLARNAPYEEALRLPLKALLVSPKFLFRVEEERPAPKGVPGAPVSDHELAVRLSYFLTSTMPDEELFGLAGQGKLADPVLLETQVRRLLGSPKSRALTKGFGMQWLQIGKLDQARPSTEYFPTFNGRLKESMRQEVELFVDGLRREDRSILELIDADYSYLTPELAKHYGIGGVAGKDAQRVSLKPEQHRGGLLGMGAILAINAHVHRTSPTLRGKWILEVLFGTPPPPPPPDAGRLEEGRKKGQEPKSFRELLTQHSSQPACAACHRRIDPLGFALENFNAVGEWRESHGGQPLDTSGVLPSGERLDGFRGLKDALLRDQDRFVRNFIEQMLCYALGRELLPSDECAVREIEARVRKDGHRFGAVAAGIVASGPFRQRRAAGARE